MHGIPVCICRHHVCMGSPQEGLCFLNPWDQSIFSTGGSPGAQWSQLLRLASHAVYQPLSITLAPYLVLAEQLHSMAHCRPSCPKEMQVQSSGLQGKQAGDGRKTPPCRKTALFEGKKDICSPWGAAHQGGITVRGWSHEKNWLWAWPQQYIA